MELSSLLVGYGGKMCMWHKQHCVKHAYEIIYAYRFKILFMCSHGTI
jgi:hypothetical protein